MPHPSRSRLSLLCATALIGLAGGLQPAGACTSGTDTAGDPTLTCDTARTDQVLDARDDLTLTITPDGDIDVPAADALSLGGDRQTVLNAGRLRGGGDTNGVLATGTGLTVDNTGTIEGTDRGIRLSGGSGDFTLLNRADGEILARRQAVRLDTDALLTNTRIENWGLIDSTDGRALQSRGTGNTVINHATGRMIGGEEVIEGRMGFEVENHGLIALHGLSWDPDTRTWTDSGATVDEDGIQFASGTVDNHGVILATDDGVDLDEGTVRNHATGVIVSVGPDAGRSAAGIDIDDVLQDPDGVRDGAIPDPVSIVNAGYIEGPRAIAAAETAVHGVDIVNTGTLIGRGGTAIELAPGQGDTTITLSDGSVIDGDILFGGGGTNTLVLGPFTDGARFGGAVGAQTAGALLPATPATGGGAFDVLFDDALGLDAVRRYAVSGTRFDLEMVAGAGTIGFSLFGVEDFTLSGTSYDAAAFADLLDRNGVGVIPLPAAGWLLLGGLGALAALGRRRRAA